MQTTLLALDHSILPSSKSSRSGTLLMSSIRSAQPIVGKRLAEELAARRGHALLHELPVPLRGADVGRQEALQARLDRLVVWRVAHDRLDCRRVYAQVQAEETVHAALEVLGVACRQRAMLLHVLALRDEAGQIQEPGPPVRDVGRGQAGEDFSG